MKIFAVSVIFILTSSVGPTLAHPSCDGILANGMRNIAVTYNSNVASGVKYSRNCGKDFSQLDEGSLTEAEFEVFGYGGVQGGQSRTKRETALKQWCQVNLDKRDSSGENFERSEIIYAKSVDAWSRCNELFSENTIIDPLISDDARHVSMSIRYTGPTEGVRFYGITSENFTCDVRAPTADGKGVLNNEKISSEPNGVIIGPSAISVHCTRSAPVQRQVNGTEIEITPAAMVSVRTASRPMMLSFAATSDKSLPAKDVDRLQAQLAELQQGLNANQTSMSLAISGALARVQTLEEKNNQLQAFRDRLQSGASSIGRAGNFAALRVQFPRPFSEVPRVFVSASPHPNDFIVIVPKDITREGFTAWFWRANGRDWGAQQQVNWIAIQGDL